MRAAVAAVLAGLVLAPAGLATGIPGPAAPDAEQTHPTVTPRHGTRHTVFTLRFTAREATGQHDGSTWSYDVMAVRRGSGPPAACTSTVSIDPGAATAGQRVRVTLHAARRWCTGSFRATVVLSRQIVCTQPTSGPPVACPAIAFAPLDAGHTTFVVRTR